MNEGSGSIPGHGCQGNDQEYCPPDDQSLTKTKYITSSDCTPNSSPKKNSATQNNSIYPGYSPAAIDSNPDNSNRDNQQEIGQYFQDNDGVCYQEQSQYYQSDACASEFQAANSQEASTAAEQNGNCTDEEPTEEGILFGESSYGDEISRWMEDQSSFQQHEPIASNGHVEEGGNGGDDSSVVLAEQSNDLVSHGAQRGINDSGSRKAANDPQKRPASAMSDSSSVQNNQAKRRQRSQSTSQSAPPENKSPSRIRMDEALHECSQSRTALRDALLALEKAKAVVGKCRSRYNEAKSLVESTAREECKSLLEEDTPWNSMFHQLKRYKEETGDCNVKQNNNSNKTTSLENDLKRLSAWVGKNRKDGKQRKRSSSISASGTCKRMKKHVMKEGESCEESDVDNAEALSTAVVSSHDESHGVSILPNEDHDDSSVFDDIDPDSIHADPYKSLALDGIGFDWDPRNSRWNNMYEELRRYKDEHGNTLVPHANFGLGAWVKRQQVQYTLFTKGDGTKSDLTEERVRLLNDLGFIWSRRTNTWNENFQRLAKWKEKHGSCHVPDDSKDPELATLHKWMQDQRVHFKRQIAEGEENCSDDPNATEKKDSDDKSSGVDGNSAAKKKSKRKPPKLSRDKIEKLKSIGFEFDSRDAKWLQKLDVLLKYKQSHGDFLVPTNYPEDPTLSNWVASQRAQYKLYLKGSKSHMTDRRLKILTDAGFPFSVQKVKKEAAQQDRVTFDAKPWLDKYKDFLLYIATHGSLESLQKANPCLAEWLAKQREECLPADVSTSENQSSTEMKERTALMEASQFFLFSQINKANVLLLRDKNVEPSSVIKEESSWDDQFGNLAAWYIKNGSYTPKGMPSKLKKFVSRQQENHRLFDSGVDSELTSERIEKLEGIRFPFDKATPKDTRDDVTTATQKIRSWEEFRLDLATIYIQKGNYDANSLDDVELRRWASEQKRQHKLYLAGKQSTLSFDQIQRLVDIKFISKRPKQKSWTENCADLMAFRIQLGTFDVASAHVVTNPKARSANPCTNSTVLKNLQEWAAKLRGHYCESSQSVTTNDELTVDQKAKLDTAGFPWTGPWDSGGELSSKVPCSIQQQEQTVVPAESITPMAPLKSNLFGMTLEIHHAADRTV